MSTNNTDDNRSVGISENEADRISALKRYAILDTLPEEAFDRVTRIAAAYLDVPIALISLVDETRQWFKSHHGLDIVETHRDIAFCTHAIQDDLPLVVEDAARDPRFMNNPLVKEDPNIRFYAGAPLRTPDGFRLGTICAIDRVPRTLTEEQQRVLVDLAGMVVDQMELRLAFTNVSNEKAVSEQAATKGYQSSKVLQSILDNVVDGVITINEQGHVGTFNHAAETLFGYAADEVIGKNIKMLMPDPYAAEHDGYLQNYQRTGKTKIIGTGCEVVGQRKDGSTFPMDLSVAAVTLGDRRVFTGIVRDITERKIEEDELVEIKEEAEKANLAKSNFLSRMSHELRTPLNAVLGFAQLLEMEDLDAQSQESVGHIIKAGRHLTGLINEVLDIASVESGRQNLSPEPVLVCDVLEDAWSLMRPLAAERDIRLKYGVPVECNVHILVDQQKLKQVLLNLISNAIKYNHQRGFVELFCREVREGFIRISVADSGPGIAADNFERIFEPFERLEASQSKVEGTGIGLALSKALVEAMGGLLNLESEYGKGSTFWIEFPLIDGAIEKDPAEQAKLDMTMTSQVVRLEPATVLYIEDNITNFRLVEVALTRRPHIELIAAMEGGLGVDLALRHKPDLILLDLHMPGLVGGQVLASLKSHPETQHVPVVIISADATKRQIQRLLAAGAHAYLTKPFNIKNLLRTVDAVLASRADTTTVD